MVLNQAREEALRQFSSAELAAFQSYLQRLCRDLMDEA